MSKSDLYSGIKFVNLELCGCTPGHIVYCFDNWRTHDQPRYDYWGPRAQRGIVTLHTKNGDFDLRFKEERGHLTYAEILPRGSELPEQSKEEILKLIREDKTPELLPLKSVSSSNLEIYKVNGELWCLDMDHWNGESTLAWRVLDVSSYPSRDPEHPGKYSARPISRFDALYFDPEIIEDCDEYDLALQTVDIDFSVY